jgi:hypothetical protein
VSGESSTYTGDRELSSSAGVIDPELQAVLDNGTRVIDTLFPLDRPR